MPNKNNAGIFLQFSFGFRFQAQKNEKRKLEADSEAEGRRGRGLGSDVWRRSCGDDLQLGIFAQKLQAGPSGGPAVCPPGQTDAGLRDGRSADAPARMSWERRRGN